MSNSIPIDAPGLLARAQAESDPGAAFETLRAADLAADDLREFTWYLLADRTGRVVFATGCGAA